MSMRQESENKNVFPVTHFDPAMSYKDIEEAVGRDKQGIFSKQKFPRIVSTNASCLEVFNLQIFPFTFEFELGLHTSTCNMQELKFFPSFG